MMVYILLSDFVILLHLLWIIFLIFGLLLALKYVKISFIHLTGLVFTLVLNLGEWYCPLTYLENYLHGLYDPQLPYADSFITRNLHKLIYLDLDEAYLRIGAIAWVGLNMVGYALLLRRRWWRHRGIGHSA
jgi:hypothetical protein